MIRLHLSVFTPDAQAAIMRRCTGLNYLNSPGFLGVFGFRAYKLVDPFQPFHATGDGGWVVDRMAALVPEQTFTHVYVQRYQTTQAVREHRDPQNNIGYTLIAPFGKYTGGQWWWRCGGVWREQVYSPGDVLQVPCTINGVQGPLHRVDPVLTGIRQAVILGTVAA